MKRRQSAGFEDEDTQKKKKKKETVMKIGDTMVFDPFLSELLRRTKLHM